MAQLVKSGIVRSLTIRGDIPDDSTDRCRFADDPTSLHGAVSDVRLGVVVTLDSDLVHPSAAVKALGAECAHGPFPRALLDQDARLGCAPRDGSTQGDFVRVRMENYPVRDSVTGGRLLEFTQSIPGTQACTFTATDAHSALGRSQGEAAGRAQDEVTSAVHGLDRLVSTGRHRFCSSG